MPKQEKWVTYAALIRSQLLEMFNPDCENHINANDLEYSDNAAAFFHALSTVAPASIYNKLVDEQKNALEFNQMANSLCFQFCDPEK